MNSSIASPPASRTEKKLIQWPLLSIPLGVAFGIILRNPALGLAVALFGGTLFLPLNRDAMGMKGRRATTFMISAPIVMLGTIVLAAMGFSMPVWIILGGAFIYDSYVRRHR